MGRSLGGQEGWVLQLGCPEASQPGTVGCGQAGREGAPGSPQRPNFAWCFVKASCDLAPAGSSRRLTLHGKLYLALSPVPRPPGPYHAPSSLKKGYKKKP